MDGYEVARRIRALLGEKTPGLVAVTGYGQPSDLLRSRNAGFEPHLVKPIELERLAQLFASLDRPAV